MAAARRVGPDYNAAKDKCLRFLKDFVVIDDGGDADGPKYKYMEMLQEISDRASKTLEIHMDDVIKFDGDGPFALAIESNTRRYLELFADAADDALPIPNRQSEPDDIFDHLLNQRMQGNLDHPQGKEGAEADARDSVPRELRRRFEVQIIPRSERKAVSIREVKAPDIGRLVSVKGLITRCTDVKPLVEVATYTCDECGFEIYQEVKGNKFMPLFECPSRNCKINNTKGDIHLQIRGSKFVKFQEAKIQELADQVPKGHIPRTMTIHIAGELTRKVGPGDEVALSGIFLPVPYTGYRAMRAGLVADTFLQATHILQLKKRYEEFVAQPETMEEVNRVHDGHDAFRHLAQSIAPEIFGHEDVKKVLLLLMVGGVTRQLKDGMKIRGDLHVCLMGDPGVAKSQLLKHICAVAPRAVYTTGRGSSGVGLTAAITRDSVTNDLVLEGGALVLADMGICCIDEFDKMDESDRTAIHEVMEQQTVSIAKAGITTTLNARTSVLAAANPAWGRYDIRRTPAENINLPPALLSRFDILWLMLDRPNEDSDTALADHVLYVHRHLKPPDLSFEPLSAAVLKAYVARARTFQPSVPRDMTDFLADTYSNMRQEEAQSANPHTYTTARTLLSILRLSQSLARLRWSDTVSQRDVEEALRLIMMSKASLNDDDADGEGGRERDRVGAIYALIKLESERSRRAHVKFTDLLNWVTRKGYGEEELKVCLHDYAEVGVWQVDPETWDMTWVDEQMEHPDED